MPGKWSSPLFLKTSKEGETTPYQGSPFYYLGLAPINRELFCSFFPIVDWLLSNFHLPLLVLPSRAKQKKCNSVTMWQPLKYLNKIIICLLCLSFSRLNSPCPLDCSSEDMERIQGSSWLSSIRHTLYQNQTMPRTKHHSLDDIWQGQYTEGLLSPYSWKLCLYWCKPRWHQILWLL